MRTKLPELSSGYPPETEARRHCTRQAPPVNFATDIPRGAQVRACASCAFSLMLFHPVCSSPPPLEERVQVKNASIGCTTPRVGLLSFFVPKGSWLLQSYIGVKHGIAWDIPTREPRQFRKDLANGMVCSGQLLFTLSIG